MPGIGIITNPHSRRNRRYPEQMRRLGYILGHNDSYEMTNRIEDVSRVAEQFKKNDIDILALNGGDGTNHVTLSTFIEVYGDTSLPRITFLRGGTMNTISNGIGIKGKPSRLLANLVEKYYTKQPFETTRRDMLKITDDTGTRYGFIFGNGVVSNFLEAYYDTGNPSPTTAAVLLSRAIAGLPFGGGLAAELVRPFTAQLDFADGESWPERDYTSVLAATIDQIGLGFRPFIRCEEKPGTFHVLALTAGPFEIVRELPNIRLGRPIAPDRGLSRVSDHVTITSDSSITYTIDGDMHTSDGPVTLEAGPRVEIIIK
jgi:diacylglycerol kinase family enzyme